MEKTPPEEKPIITPVTVESKSNNKLVILLVVLTVIGFSAASVLIGYVVATKMLTKSTTTTPNSGDEIACTADAKICPDGSSVGRSGPTCEFSPCPGTQTVITANPTIKPNTHGNTFQSAKNNVGFYYGAKLMGSNEMVAVTEIGNKIYVHGKGTAPTSGQSVEIFTKDPKITLEQAITNQFLKGISPDVCFVQKETSTDPNIMKATISYPVPANSDEPPFMFGDACPNGYKRSNGMAYFYYDIRVPSKYFYFSIGQYGIPAYSDDQNTMWQTTFAAY